MMHERRDRATWHLRERGEVVHTRTVWVCANPGFAQTYCCTPLHTIISCLRKRSLGDVRFLPVASGPTALSEHPPPSPAATRASTQSAWAGSFKTLNYYKEGTGAGARLFVSSHFPCHAPSPFGVHLAGTSGDMGSYRFHLKRVATNFLELRKYIGELEAHKRAHVRS